MNGSSGELRARTRELDTSLDLVAFAGDGGLLFGRPGGGLAGRGGPPPLELPSSFDTLGSCLGEISAALQGIDRVAGSDPVAFVSVPFSPTRPILAIVPQMTFRQSGEQATVTTTGDVDPKV